MFKTLTATAATLLLLATAPVALADDTATAENTADSATTETALPDGIVAIVNGKQLPRTLLDAVLGQFPPGQPAPDEQTVIEELINIQVLAQLAESEKLDQNPDVQAELDLQRAQTLANAWVKNYAATIEVSDEDLKAEYDRQTAGMGQTEYRARHILLDSEKEAQDVIDALAAGEDFVALANERSKDPGSEGGELGWFQPEMMAEAFGAAVKSLEVGKVTESPVQTEFGWHIIELQETRDSALPDFESVKPGLRNLVERNRIGEKVESLAAEAEVQR